MKVMKKVRLGLASLFVIMLVLQIDTQAQESVQNRKVITAEEESSSTLTRRNGGQNFETPATSAKQLAQASQVRTYQKRTINFDPPSDNQKATAKKANQKYQNGNFRRPKRNPKHKD